MKVHQIDTPALILEKAVFDGNLQTMKNLLSMTSMALRPHYKSHKCAAIVKLQLEQGAKGITCAKLSEAEDLAQMGVEDILIANQIVQPEKLPRVAALAKKCRLSICVDTAENILALEEAMAADDATLYCLVEYEVGMLRCGVETHEEFVELAKLISRQPHLVFEGIQAYAGNLSHETDLPRRQQASDEIERDLTALKKALTDAGLPPKEITGGSTGTVENKPGNSIYTEMQCGSYVFMDRSYGTLGLNFKNALFLLTSVVSTRKNYFITDGGTKSLGLDQGAPTVVGYEKHPLKLSEEHGRIELDGHTCRLNDKIRYIPGHCCTTVNIHDRIYVVDGEDVVDVWDVTSRGKSQ